MKTKKIILTFIVAFVLVALTGCVDTDSNTSTKANDDRLNVVATIFPQYDFVRQIAGDSVNITMLLKPGIESHSYEPTPQDIIAIQNCDVFIYVGGEFDEWVFDILSSMDTSQMEIISLLECLGEENSHYDNAHDDNATDEHEDEDDEHDHTGEFDDHVWTSPINSIKIVEHITDVLAKKDVQNEKIFRENADEYILALYDLDKAFRDAVANGKRNTLVFGDRFPAMHFAHEYDLEYHAAFLGCADETEVSAATISELIDIVTLENIPIVFKIELSNGQIADVICEETGGQKRTFNTCHNITADDFERGTTYLELMTANVDLLKEALN